MDVAGELAATMHVSEEVSCDGHGGCHDLRGDVPSRAYNLESSVGFTAVIGIDIHQAPCP